MTVQGIKTCTREITLIPFLKEGVAFTEANLMVSVREEHNRCKDIGKLERLIEYSWCCCREKNPQLPNRLKFRLHTAVEDEETGLMHLKLGLTNCKDFMGTNLLRFPHDVEQLMILGCINYCNRGAYLAHPLGVGATVLTEDGKYIFIRRLVECCESRRLLDRPGGAPDPGQVPLEVGEYDLVKATSEDLVHEIFEAAIRAMKDEVGVPPDTLSDIELLGLVINKTKGERPTAEFIMNCSWPMEKVLLNYNKRVHKYCGNSCQIVFTSEHEVKETPLSQSMFFKGLAPSGKGAVLLIREQIRQLKEVEREKARKKPANQDNNQEPNQEPQENNPENNKEES